MKVAYVRVSTEEQNEARQVEALEKHGIEKWFIEKVSGKNKNRPQLMAMLDYVREGDTVYVHDLSRLARSTADTLYIVNQLTSKGVTLHSNKESINTDGAMGNFLLTVLAAVNQMERENTLERQREGIAIAKKKGKYKGRKKKEIPEFEDYYKRFCAGEIKKAQMARELNISRPTLDKMINCKINIYNVGLQV